MSEGRKSIPDDEEEEEQVTETVLRLEESENPVEVEVEVAPNCTHKLEDFHPRELHTLQIHSFSVRRNSRVRIGVDEETKRKRAGLAGADKPIWDIMIILQDRNR